MQQRTCLDAATVQEYTALYQEGRDLGPLVVFRDNDVSLLADGFHRYEAACVANVTTLPVVIYHGTLRDALFYATSCNLHGRPLTNADKRRRVLTVLQDSEWAQWSDNAIAKHCGVTQPFVGTVRKSLRTVISETTQASPTARTYQDKHGHVHTMETSKIGQRALAPEAQERAPEVPEGEEADVPAILTEVQDPEPPVAPATWPQTVYTGDNEWYTPDESAPSARSWGRLIWMPALCAGAGDRQARTYYTLDDDGLRHPWHGKIYLNPPYTRTRLPRSSPNCFRNSTPGIPPTRSWWSTIGRRAIGSSRWPHEPRAICFPDGKIPFVHATKNGLHPCSGQAICYFGPQVDRFAAIFVELGVIMQAMRGVAPAQLPLAATPPAPCSRRAGAICRRRARQGAPVYGGVAHRQDPATLYQCGRGQSPRQTPDGNA